jgi:hypothetical protein
MAALEGLWQAEARGTGNDEIGEQPIRQESTPRARAPTSLRLAHGDVWSAGPVQVAVRASWISSPVNPNSQFSPPNDRSLRQSAPSPALPRSVGGQHLPHPGPSPAAQERGAGVRCGGSGRLGGLESRSRL